MCPPLYRADTSPGPAYVEGVGAFGWTASGMGASGPRVAHVTPARPRGEIRERSSSTDVDAGDWRPRRAVGPAACESRSGAVAYVDRIGDERSDRARLTVGG